MQPEIQKSSRKATLEQLRASLPKQIDNHELLRIIGSGAYGDVVLARNTVTGTYRAIKIVWRTAFHDDRPYQRELEAIRNFEPISRRHEGFVQILQVGELENAFFYIMELADDEQLGQRFLPEQYTPRSLCRLSLEPLPPNDCISIAMDLAAALSVLHKAGLIHRDIKPSNIIFVDGKPKLADIGLVTAIADANSFVGTVGFVPPEGPVSPSSDIYSLGKVLYEMSTGKDRCEFPELPADLPANRTLYLELNQIVLKACDPRPDRRYRNAEAMQKELELLDAGSSIKRLRDLQRRLKAGALIATFLASLVVLGLIGKVWHDREQAAQERRIAYLTRLGTDALEKGDYPGALPFLLSAARERGQDDASDRLRIGSLVASGIKRIAQWKGPAGGGFSMDGQFLIGISNKVVLVLDSRTGANKWSIPAPEGITGVRLTPDNSQLLLLADRFLILRNIETGLSRRAELDIFDANVMFEPFGRELAVCSTNALTFLNLTDLTTERLPTTNESSFVRGVYYSPEGDRMVFLRHDGQTEVWERNPLRKISQVFEHSFGYCAVFDPLDKGRVLTGGFDRAVYWELATGHVVSKPIDHEYGIFELALSPDGRTLASASLDRTARLSDPRTLLASPRNPVLYLPDRASRVAFADSETLVVGCSDNSYHTWDLTADDPKVEDIAWEEPPNWLLATSDQLTLRAKGTEVTVEIAGAPVIMLKMGASVSSVAISPDATEFAIATRDDRYGHHGVAIYSREEPERVRHRLAHMDGVNYVGYSPSGKILVTCSEDHTAMLWDRKTAKPLFFTPLKHSWQVRHAAFSPDEKWVATAGWDDAVRIWDTRTGELIATPFIFPRFLEWVRFENGNREIVAANPKDKRLFRLRLPIAEGDLERFREALPAPAMQTVSPAGF